MRGLTVVSDLLNGFNSTLDKWRARTHVGTSDYPSRLLRSEQIPDDFKEDYITNDYAGVCSLGLTVAVGYYYYSRPIEFGCYEQPAVYFGAAILSCTVGCYLTCGTRLQWTQMPHQLRLAAFAVPYFVSITPLAQRMVYETHWEPVCSLHLLHIGFTVVGSFIYGAKIPERFIPNLFDYSFHSHCLMHVITGISALIQIYAEYVDMKTRRHLLRGDNLTVFDVFWPVAVMLTIQTLIVGLYCYKLVKLRRRETENMKIE
ncbi:membrane progestin receptor gamma-like [Corticium candelabrum]|uniref:membrane progestin receptor gamma-like n=1 Tax=Corticium candelabrum TaxID=121492 RepID=UPI002E2590BA|nr:membrane progestin receptor gamma-like [Corticium candelabrum]